MSGCLSNVTSGYRVCEYILRGSGRGGGGVDKKNLNQYLGGGI